MFSTQMLEISNLLAVVAKGRKTDSVQRLDFSIQQFVKIVNGFLLA